MKSKRGRIFGISGNLGVSFIFILYTKVFDIRTFLAGFNNN